MARVRHVTYQVSQSDCGIACAHMLITANGGLRSVRELRRAYSTGRDGLSLLDLKRIVESSGLSCRIFRVSSSALRQLELPAILPWKPTHYVVLERVGRRGYKLIDPAGGRVTVQQDEIDARYTGLALTAHGACTFSTKPDPSPWLAVGKIAWSERRAAWALLLTTLLVSLATLLVPNIVSVVVAAVDALGVSWGIATLLAVSVCVYFLALSMNLLSSVFAATRIGRCLGESLYRSLLNAPFSYFLVRPRGELLYRVNIVRNLESSLSTTIANGFASLIALLVSFIVIVLHSVSVGGLLAVVLFLYLCSAYALRYQVTAISETLNTRESLANAQVVDSLTAIEQVKGAGAEGICYASWKSVNDTVVKLRRRSSLLSGLASTIVAVMQTFLPVVVFVVVYGGSAHFADVSYAMQMQSLSTIFVGQFSAITTLASDVGEARAAVRRVDDVLTISEADVFSGDSVAEFAFPLNVERVDFRYSSFARRVVRDVSFALTEHTHVAIVGRTGSGKSTVAKLVGGLLTPTSGSVLVGGNPIREINKDDFYENVLYLPQDAPLRSATLRDNLSWGISPAPSDSDMCAALARAQFILEDEDFAQGLDTFIANGGQNVSGGQRQRIALARAFLLRPRLLILDEASSALDQRTEFLLYDQIGRLDCAILSITHRLETVKGFDRILVMRDGCIVGDGSADELLDSNREFASMYTAYADRTTGKV